MRARFLRTGRGALSPLIATVIMVAIILLLAAVLYVLVANLVQRPGPGLQLMGFTIDEDGGNWSVTIMSVPSGKLPNATFVLIRDANSNIVLPRTPFSDLTGANWSFYGIAYEDVSPSIDEIVAADRLHINRATYPPMSALEVSDDKRILAIQTLG